jgi:hypothetical protein
MAIKKAPGKTHSSMAALGLNPPQRYPSAMRLFSKVLRDLVWFKPRAKLIESDRE